MPTASCSFFLERGMFLQANALRRVIALFDMAQAGPGREYNDEHEENEDDDATAGNHFNSYFKLASFLSHRSTVGLPCITPGSRHPGKDD